MGAPRKFDHDEARQLYATGNWTQAALAETYGVSTNTIWHVLNRRQSGNKWHEQHRKPCEGGCGKLVWTTTQARPSGLCVQCLGETRRTAACGTEAAYRRGCRCIECRAAAARGRRRRRANAKVAA